MRLIMYFMKPVTTLILAVGLFIAGFKLGGFWSFVLFVIATLCFSRGYAHLELREAIHAYMIGKEHQIGFTNRNNFAKMMLHLFIAGIIFILVAIFVERVQYQALSFACIPILAMSL